MKKLTVLFLVGLMVMAFGVTAYAQPKVTMDITGYIDFAAIVTKNITDCRENIYGLCGGSLTDPNADTGVDNVGAFANSRARLKFTANAGKELKGVIFFEMDSGVWGDESGTRNSMGYWNADRAAVEVKHAYFAVGVPYFGVPVPITVTLGIQPVSIRDDYVIGVDGAGIKVNFKADPVDVDVWWAKMNEGKVYASDDNDLYAINGKMAIGESSIGAYGIYQNFNSYPQGETIYGDYGENPGNRANFYWVGGYWDGKLGPVGLVADLIYSGGSIEPGWDNTAEDVDYSGYFAAVRGTYDWEMFMFGGGAWYASGSDAEDTDATGQPGTTTSVGTQTDEVKAYVVPGGDGPGWPFGYPLVYFGGPFARANNTFATDTGNVTNAGGVGGTWGAYLYGGYKVAPWYNVWLQAMYLGDTTKNGSTNGSARENPLDPADTSLDDGKSIGFEFALTNQFTIYENLELFMGAGYLLAGDAFEFYNETDLDNDEIDNPWDLVMRLVYSF